VARAGYEIECSSGTYVRSLIADLGDAYCLDLRRTAIGPFSVKRAIGLPARGERLDSGRLIGLEAAVELIDRAAGEQAARDRTARGRRP
jgi:tRNA pseudouridine55 synthase